MLLNVRGSGIIIMQPAELAAIAWTAVDARGYNSASLAPIWRAIKPMEPGYEYHVFVSYKRSGDVGEWVHNHFHPLLVRRLEALLDEDPRVFIDREIDIGADWPTRLSDALHKSCCLVSIWTPSYFRSKWCLAEWQTIAERERIEVASNVGNRLSLTYPIVYSDGDSFPVEAKSVQGRLDMHDFAYPFEQFRRSEKYMAFFDRMHDVAESVAARINSVPAWNDNWPRLPRAVEPSPVAATQFARL